MPTMASKLKERRVSRRPPCAHGSAGPPSGPGPEPFAAFPFEKPPHKKQPQHPHKNKPALPRPSAQSGSHQGGAEGTGRKSIILPEAASRPAPLLGAGWGLASLEGSRPGPEAAVPARLDPSAFSSPTNAPHMFCRGRRFPIK